MKPSSFHKGDLRFAAVEAANSAQISIDNMDWDGNPEMREYRFRKMEARLEIARIYAELAATFEKDRAIDINYNL